MRILFLHVIFEFSVMSFGLWNGPSVFVMLMNTVFVEIGKFAGAFTDDIETVGEHILIVIDHPEHHKWTWKWKRCSFFGDEIRC